MPHSVFEGDAGTNQVIVVRHLDVGINRVEPGGVQHEFGVTDEINHGVQLGPRGLERRGRQPRQTADIKTSENSLKRNTEHTI